MLYITIVYWNSYFRYSYVNSWLSVSTLYTFTISYILLSLKLSPVNSKHNLLYTLSSWLLLHFLLTTHPDVLQLMGRGDLFTSGTVDNVSRTFIISLRNSMIKWQQMYLTKEIQQVQNTKVYTRFVSNSLLYASSLTTLAGCNTCSVCWNKFCW